MKPLLAMLCLIFCACASPKFEPFNPPIIDVQPTPPYSVKEQLDNLPMPKKLIKTWVKEEKDSKGNTFFVPSTKEEATHLLITSDQYANVGVLLQRAIALKAIALEQETLVNTYIDQLNQVKKLFVLEQNKAGTYRQEWIDSENAYRQEKAQHTLDNRINRTGMYLITIGSIIVLAIAL
jgi:hypothetical protein